LRNEYYTVSDKHLGKNHQGVYLKIYSKRRTWRKLHLGVDEASGEIIASVLTTNDFGDGEILPDLLDQIDSQLNQVSGDGAYGSF